MKHSKHLPETKPKFLSQSQVDSLPDGTKVMIVWSGGNGPHKYEVCSHRGGKYTKTERGKPAERISFVGKNKPFTLVWVINNQEKEKGR